MFVILVYTKVYIVGKVYKMFTFLHFHFCSNSPIEESINLL